MERLLLQGEARRASGSDRALARRSLAILGMALLSGTALSSPAFAQSAPAEDQAKDEPIVVTGALNALPVQDVGTVFGFDKTLVETPRSASSISKEQMDRFGITEIYDLVAQSPGTFTNSFFGVGGALDIRGTPGEVYFRGVRRLDNPGNYPTPIAAADRIDIVRGPASPIYGPSKTGGYMNFVPRTARVKGGKLMAEPKGEIGFTTGSYAKNVLSASLIGPATIGGSEFGYSLYGEIENSGSYYRNMDTRQTILQASFDNQLTDSFRIEFGGMYHNYKGQQNGGWNRLTQALVDNGTYITGQAKPLDKNADGQLSPSEFASAGNFNPFGSFACGGGSPFASSLTDACFKNNFPLLALVNTGTTTLSRQNTLTGPDDKLNNRALTGYFDMIYDGPADLEIKNQLFFDGYKNLNENAYGFSQFHDSYVIEDKIVIAKKFESSAGKFSFQLSPSIRYTKFKHGDDFNFEYFHRVDLTVGYTPLSDRLLSTECDCEFASYVKGHYTDLGIAALADFDLAMGLDVTLGGRYDSIHAKASTIPSKLRVPVTINAENTDGVWSYSASVSYKLPFGLIPYFTYGRQSTVIAGQGAEIDPANLAADTWTAASKLIEGGVKGSFLDNKLYAAVAVYDQKRTDFNVQSITVNQSVQTKGIEAELRWAVNDDLLLTGSYTKVNVYNLTGLNNGTLFSFFGIADLINVKDPTLYLGGQPIGLVPIPNKNASKRAGIPENTFSLTGTYSFPFGLALSGSLVHVQSVFSGQSQAVRLPAYTLVDLGATFNTGNWLFRVVVKNATNEKYFRANFTELFGSTIVLPERPRNVQATVSYKF